jgi:exodeoxyribonuclease VII large subunit
LWAFNDEQVVRAIFAAQHPVISGVGHETDFTIADFVADLRAPTPSAAAELAVPNLAEIRPLVHGMQARLVANMQAHLVANRREVDTLSRALTHLSPRLRLDNSRQRVDMLTARLDRAMSRRLDRWQNRLMVVAARLTTVGPLATLARGYAIVRDENGRIIRSTAQVNDGAQLSVQVEDGAFDVTASK